ncbi:A-kinase anchor protein 2 isoform X1 [Oryzias latipes]|uniref:A-kinase anchor protein 2 isoform X1 n=1 Tax=Oryzias latipes TaxID=8090 RepID=UPI0005CBFA16|nr:A-kinase anchor protein 2 isoform X1 [Oryzias latipes]
MNSTPKRWILKPLSPILRPSDLQRMTFPAYPLNCSTSSSSNSSLVESSFKRESSLDRLAQTSHVSILQNGNTDDSDKYHLSSSGSVECPSSSSSLRCGFYSFVEDPMSPEAKQNESWMVSSQRQTYLATLKEETGFKLQAYNGIKKPQTLFSVDKEDLQYKIDPCICIEVICETEEMQLRKEIIRSQAPRKILAQTTRLEGNLSQCTETYRTVLQSSRTKPCQPTQPETTEKYQTNFKTIRKHFLNMEQENLKAPLSPDRSTKFPQVLALRSNLNVPLSQRQEEQSTGKISPNLAATEEDQLNQQKRPQTSLSRPDELERRHRLTSEQEDGRLTSNLNLFTTHKSALLNGSPTGKEILLLKEENLQRSSELDNNSPGEEAEMKSKCSSSYLSPRDTKFVGQNLKKENDTQNLEEQDHQHHEIPEQSPLRGNADRTDNIETEDKPQVESGTGDSFPFPCCPHRHHEESKFCRSNVAASSRSEGDSEVWNAMCFQKDPAPYFTSAPYLPSFPSLKSTPHCESDSRGPAPLNLIKKEIQEVLKREQELKEMMESRKVIRQQLLSPASLVETANMMAVRQFYPQPNKEKLVSFSSSSACPSGHVTSDSSNAHQRWTTSSRVQQVPPSLQSLTEIPVQDFEGHQAKLRLEESSYGGILLVDNINNKVIESTRVVRQKNRQALRWEAGVFTNKEK